MEKEERGRILADVADSLGVSEPEALSQFREQARNRQREKEPLVCCVTLTKDRPQMLQLAIACFRTQTYPRKRMVVFDTGSNVPDDTGGEEFFVMRNALAGRSIGYLRNRANQYNLDAEIILHMDDDDWSHPERIAEQVALLQASGKECVGYREMLFWNSRVAMIEIDPMKPHGAGVLGTVKSVGEAWLYSNGNPRYCLGTSLCYWRSVWERRPFEDKAYGEDTAWLLGVDSLGYSSFGADISLPPSIVPPHLDGYDPRMIASIHDGNTSPAYRGELMRASEKQGGEWKRAPQWDDYCRRTMEGVRV